MQRFFADAELSIRPARPDDLAEVLGVLNEAAGWLVQRGIGGWPCTFAPTWLEPDLCEGRIWTAALSDEVVATFTLGWQDPMWPDDGRAGYLHRFAVRRKAAGLGSSLLGRMADAVQSCGKDRLRLDCAADNVALRAYYEQAGFVHVHDLRLPAALALWSPPGTLLSLYEQRLEKTAAPGS